MPGDFARLEEDGTITLLGPGQHVRQHRRREGLPRGGRGRAQVPPGRLRRARRRRARRAAGPAGRRAGAAARRRTRRTSPTLDAHVRDADRRATRCRAASGWSTRSAARPAARPTTAGRSSTPSSTTGDAPDRAGRTSCGPRCATCSASSTRSSASRPSEHVAAAISRAGGLGVLGCVRFNDPADLDAALTWHGREHRRQAVRRGHRDARARSRPRARRSTWTG